MKHSEEELKKLAVKIRKDVIKIIYKVGSGHPGGSLGLVEIFVAFYKEILNHDPKNPLWEERDRLILSNGHVCPARYAVMAECGYFPKDKLYELGSFGSILQGHPDRRFLPALETTSGPLGCGLGEACGIALAAKIDKKRFRTYVITSDGEHNEGNHWEAVMFASKYKLSNLTMIVDRNSVQIGGTTEEIMPIESLKEKYNSFNWNVLEIDGHDFGKITKAILEARKYYLGPSVLIANTVFGRGVSFMENNFDWHSKVPNKEELEKALEELRSMKGKITSYGE